MKYKLSNFSQISNTAIEKLNSHNPKIPATTRWLYIHLCLLEHRFTAKDEDFFFRSIKQLSKDTGFSQKTIIEGIKTLEKLGLIQTSQMHWINPKTNKKSTSHISTFKL